MSKFLILNDHPKMRNAITAELATDEDGHLRLRINGKLVLYITEDGRISLLNGEVLLTSSQYRFQLSNNIIEKDDE